MLDTPPSGKVYSYHTLVEDAMRCKDCKADAIQSNKRCALCIRKRLYQSTQYRMKRLREGKCVKCGVEREWERFGKQTCMKCARPATKSKGAIIKYKYGLTIEQLAQMEKEHNGVCGLCGLSFKGKYVIDHCHATGKVRGLLHRQCNIALGFYEKRGGAMFEGYINKQEVAR